MQIPGLPDPDLAARPLVASVNDHPSGSTTPHHRHQRAQLIFVILGALRLETGEGLWVAPPGRAAWIPGGILHRAHYTNRSSVHVAYIDSLVYPGLPENCAVFALSGLLRELVARAIGLGWHWPREGSAERVMGLLVDEVAGLVPLGLFLPQGRDPRLRRVIDGLTAAPGDDRGLEAWAQLAGTSPRTLARLFHTETALPFGRWREQLRLTRAIERLADGDSVTKVAFELGYAGTSAFTTMFTRAMGQPPRAYLAAMDKPAR